MNETICLEERARTLLRQKIAGKIDRNPFKDPALAEEIDYLESHGYIASIGQTPKSTCFGYAVADTGRQFIANS